MRAADFELLIRLLPQSFTSNMLVQGLAERGWDTNQTLHIAERDMSMTLHDFYRMTELRVSSPIISLKGELGMALSVELLGHTFLN